MPNSVSHPPVDPIPELAPWAATLEAIGREPMEFCEDLPMIARRVEAWWAHGALDRPVFIGAANADPARPITRRLDLLEDPDEWFEAKFQDMLATHRVGEMIPNIRLDFGAVLLGALFSAETHFGGDTTWTRAFIKDDWSNAPDFTIRDDNKWWRILRDLARRVAADARGRYFVCTPDLGGSADVLLNLRGSTELCMDVLDQPERASAAIERIYPAWRAVFRELYRLTVGQGAGLTHWLHLWSDRPHIVPACDFAYMIGPEEFQRVCLPDIARQAATVGRAIFHLDGVGSTRHIDALLELPEIQAVQFTPGKGTTSALRWVEMFRKIQAKGRSALVVAPPEEVLALCDELKPEGLAFMFEAPPAPKDFDDLFAQLCRRFGCRG